LSIDFGEVSPRFSDEAEIFVRVADIDKNIRNFILINFEFSQKIVNKNTKEFP